MEGRVLGKVTAKGKKTRIVTTAVKSVNGVKRKVKPQRRGKGNEFTH